MELNIDSLEKLLVANWTKFIDRRALINFVRDCLLQYLQKEHSCQALTATFSRFELVENGFLVWIEFKLVHETTPATGTIEALVDWHGQFHHVQTV